jgi:hypothetical protein
MEGDGQYGGEEMVFFGGSANRRPHVSCEDRRNAYEGGASPHHSGWFREEQG